MLSKHWVYATAEKTSVRVVFTSLEVFVHVSRSKAFSHLGGHSPAVSPGHPGVQGMVVRAHSYTMREGKQITQYRSIFMPTRCVACVITAEINVGNYSHLHPLLPFVCVFMATAR